MQPHLEIEFGHLPGNDAAAAAAHEGLALLQRACANVGACHVTVAGPPDGHHLCQPLCVRIRVQVSGAILSVEQAQKAGDAAETTVRQAFRAALRLVLDRAAAVTRAAAMERRRPSIPRLMPAMHKAPLAPEHP